MCCPLIREIASSSSTGQPGAGGWLRIRESIPVRVVLSIIICHNYKQYQYMVRICPKCGTQDPDDGALFCHTCGTRLPSRIPEKTGIVCPGCGTANSDMQAVFCNKCGSPLQIAPHEPARDTVLPPGVVPPAKKTSRCPSCGATLKDENRYYCDACGAYIRGTSLYGIPRKDNLPSSPGAGDAIPGANRSEDGTEGPLPAKGRGVPLRWGLMGAAAVIVLILIAASFSGMIPGTSQKADGTPAPQTQSPTPAPAIQKTIPAKTPTPAPVKTTTRVTTTAVPVKTTVTVPTGVSAGAANVSVNATANASVTVTQILPVTNASQLLSIGQTAYDGKGNLTVTSVAFRDKMSDPTPSYAIGKQYLVVSVTYQNLQLNQTIDADLSSVKVTDGGGYTYEPVSDILLETPFMGTAIPSRERRTGNLLFIVPPQATFLKLHYSTANQTGATFQLT